MSYLNLDSNYFDHIKTTRLVARLGFGAELLPLILWCHASRYHPNGLLKGYSANELKLICRWTGDAQAMLQALLDVGILLDCDDSNYQIHDWDDHQGHIEAFHERAKTAARARWNKMKTHINDATSNATSNATSITKHATSNAPTIPNLTIPNQLKVVFIPPTLEAVTTYCLERKNGINAHKWHSFYTAKDWMIGKNKMKDWKAAVRTWEKEDSFKPEDKRWL